MTSSKWLFILLFLGLVFRITISFQNYSGDVTTLMLWGEDAVKHGLAGFYDRNFEKSYGHISPNYPPLSVLLYALTFLTKIWIYKLAWGLNLSLSFFPSNLIPFLEKFNYHPYLIKLPAILADIGISYLTYLFLQRIVKNKKSNWPIIASALVSFNPAYFYNSSIWGQNDSLPLFFIFLSFYLLFFTKKLTFSAISLALALLVKQTVIIFVPFYLITLLRRKNTLIPVLISIIIFIAFFIPFYKQGNIITFSFSTYLHKILLTSGIPYTSNHAFNFWYLLTGSRKVLASEEFIFNMSYESFGYLTAGFILILILYKLIRNKFQERDIFYAGFLIPLTTFLFITKMHERHLILALPFLLLLTYKNRLLLYTYIFVSIFNFLNMYHDWWSPNIFLLMQFLSFEGIIIVLTGILFGLYLIALKEYFLVNKK